MDPVELHEAALAALNGLGANPLHRDAESWSGRLISLDETSAEDFGEVDVAEVVAAGEDGDVYDGTTAAVLRLHDGRFVSFETFYGPTGNGFAEDAYGGDADLKFAADLETVVRLGLTDEGRRLCGLENPGMTEDRTAPTLT